MPDPQSPLPLPPEPLTRAGAPRRVGVELEMQGPDVAVLSALVAGFLGGEVEAVSRYEHRVRGDPAGDWKVELDFAYLVKRGRDHQSGPGVLGQLDDVAEELLAAGSQAVVPMEVISPPLPMRRLHELEGLISRLRDAGARGTRDSLAYAFGLHLNPELPDTDARTILRYLQAFLCLFDWLRAEARVDLVRRLTVYVDPFPGEYVRHVLQPDYHPDVGVLIDDYLAHNPTRNRALDLLPLFALLDEPRVRAVVDDPRIKPRPTLHYRLPNCEIDEPGWGIRGAWYGWLQVEHLAGDARRLKELCARYLDYLDRPLARLVEEDWAEQVKPWLRAPADL
jgi:hypothetical protein